MPIPDIPLEFVLFALTLVGVALFHHRTLRWPYRSGLVTLVQTVFTGFKTGPGVAGLMTHFGHEWVILANLFLGYCGICALSRISRRVTSRVAFPISCLTTGRAGSSCC